MNLRVMATLALGRYQLAWLPLHMTLMSRLGRNTFSKHDVTQGEDAASQRSLAPTSVAYNAARQRMIWSRVWACCRQRSESAHDLERSFGTYGCVDAISLGA